MSVEQILITTLFMEKVSLVYSELTRHIICSLWYVGFAASSLGYIWIHIFLQVITVFRANSGRTMLWLLSRFHKKGLCLSGRSSRKNHKWRGPDENIRANLRQYGTEKMYLDVMVSDASKPVWREAALFDAVITDRRSSQLIIYICKQKM